MKILNRILQWFGVQRQPQADPYLVVAENIVKVNFADIAEQVYARPNATNPDELILVEVIYTSHGRKRHAGGVISRWELTHLDSRNAWLHQLRQLIDYDLTVVGGRTT